MGDRQHAAEREQNACFPFHGALPFDSCGAGSGCGTRGIAARSRFGHAVPFRFRRQPVIDECARRAGDEQA
jgi:hypothetical protein